MEEWPNSKPTPSDVMYVALQNGDITMAQYVEWFKTNKSWEDVKNIINDGIDT